MIRIVTDSVSSIPKEIAVEKGIDLIPLFLRFDGAEHVETEMDIDGFYESLEDRVDDLPTSSQPSQQMFLNIFEDAAHDGDDVLGIFISEELSGTFEGAFRAANTCRSHNIDFRCVLIDTKSAAYDEAFAVFDAIDMRDQGGTLEECAAAAENAIMSSRVFFAPESLKFLKAGGRIGAASALLGSMVQIVPIITVKDGVVEAFSKVRSHKKAMHTILEYFKKDIEEFGLKRVVVHYVGKKSAALDDFRQKVEELVGYAVDAVPVSPVIGSHVGTAIGLAYECLGYIRDKLTKGPAELVVEI